MLHITDHGRTKALSPGRMGSPHERAGFWLDKRPDGRSEFWQIAWYDKAANTVRYKSTRTRELEIAKDALARFSIADAGARPATPIKQRRALLVYFIGAPCGAGGIKIGVAYAPAVRLAQLQANSPVPLRIMAVTDGGRALEMTYHRQFAEHRLHGEWFARHPDILAEIERLSN